MSSLAGSRASASVSRRSVLKGATALGTAALVTPCGTPLKAQPKRGGTLRVGMARGSTTDAMDPGSWDADFMIFQAHTRNNYLTEIATDGSLCRNWPKAGKPRRMRRSGHSRSERASISFRAQAVAEDVIASLNHHRGDDSTSAARPIVEDVVDMKADGMNVIITLANGNADFPFVLSDYHLPILPAQGDKIDPETRDGCGPFRIVDLEFGVGARYERHDGYWKSGLPYIDAIEQLVIHDDDARQSALISGEVNYIDTVDLNAVSELGRTAGIEILSVTGTQHYGLPMDTRAAPFSDVNVRLALKYAINRQQLVDTILNGYGSLGNDHPIGPGARLFNTDLPQKEFDPDKSKFHLKQAGPRQPERRHSPR